MERGGSSHLSYNCSYKGNCGTINVCFDTGIHPVLTTMYVHNTCMEDPHLSMPEYGIPMYNATNAALNG